MADSFASHWREALALDRRTAPEFYTSHSDVEPGPLRMRSVSPCPISGWRPSSASRAFRRSGFWTNRMSRLPGSTNCTGFLESGPDEPAARPQGG